MIHFQCPRCGRAITVRDSNAGEYGNCPGCSLRLRAPKRKGLTAASGCLLASILFCSGVLICGGVVVYGIRENGAFKGDVEEATIARGIHYEILRQWDVNDEGLGMEILVDESASKRDVMKLAESLSKEYAGKYSVIDIYDSREACESRLDPSYPEKNLDRHWLVQMAPKGKVFAWDDGQEVHWIAKGRTH